VVYDVTSMKSFEDIGKYWVQEIKNFGDKGVQLIIIGNKSDLGTEGREVPREVAEKFASENNMKHFEASAKTSE
jgi:GTPase SAR1 family protein